MRAAARGLLKAFSRPYWTDYTRRIISEGLAMPPRADFPGRPFLAASRRPPGLAASHVRSPQAQSHHATSPWPRSGFVRGDVPWRQSVRLVPAGCGGSTGEEAEWARRWPGWRLDEPEGCRGPVRQAGDAARHQQPPWQDELLTRQVRRSAIADDSNGYRPLRPSIEPLAASDGRGRVPRLTGLNSAPGPDSTARSVGRRELQRQAWQWALAQQASQGTLPAGSEIGRQHGRHERWGRLVKSAGLAGELADCDLAETTSAGEMAPPAA